LKFLFEKVFFLGRGCILLLQAWKRRILARGAWWWCFEVT